MGRLIDLTGRRFGKLVVIERAENDTDKKPKWLCLCDCKNTKVIKGHSLLSGATNSCGCLYLDDLTGKKFGLLTVIQRFKTKDKKHSWWSCKCECGNSVNVSANYLHADGKKSCGCIKPDLTGMRFVKLLVMKEVGGRYKNRPRSHWLCRCDCGNEITVASGLLNSGNIQSCGCYRRDYFKKEYGLASFNSLWSRYVSGARKRKIDFSLTKDEFKYLINQNCSYCGCEPHLKIKSKCDNGDLIYNGVDRIDSSRGYEIGNVATCCWDCNRIKGEMKTEDLIFHLEKMLDFYKNNSIK